MATVTVNGVALTVPDGATVLQACELAGLEIPRFCYHERLSIAGNCRMCLVEIEKAPKPVASCAYPIADKMAIRTDTKLVRDARRGVMEFLLINHPLDCPICDQGGECDLQDQAVGYGMDHSRYAENKRAVRDKDLGPLVKTVMTRCIHCTRCIRFGAEVAGVPEMGATARGETMEIGTYVQRALTSELSGNIIDICPVGALTSKPYAFVARPWELRHTDSIDVLDAVGTNIRIDARGPEVLRILPRLHEAVNEEWIGDKSRFAHDGLKRRRLDRPWIRHEGKLIATGWDEAFATIAARLQGLAGARIGAIVGDLVECESMTVLRDLWAALGSANLDCRQDGAKLDPSHRAFYLFNTSIAGMEQADAVLLIGSNPRREAPVLNARLRKAWLANGLPIGLIGAAADLTYPVRHLGEGADCLARRIAGEIQQDDALGALFRGAQRPMVVVGQGALTGADGADVLAAAWSLAAQIGAITPAWNGFNILHTAAARVGGLDLGVVPGPGGKDVAGMMGGGADVLWLLGADEFDTDAIGADTFVVYQGHHGDRGARRADVILPGAAYTEKSGTWVNTEGRVQRGAQAVFPPGEAREDWKILRAFADRVGYRLPYQDLAGVRRRMEAINPVFQTLDTLTPAVVAGLFGPAGTDRQPGSTPLRSTVPVYYQTDPISRASPTMALCVAQIVPEQAALMAAA